ncbi:MAG: hypothetical protein MUO54_04425, partial [Anaerolineales bacterium]|nr:hypothetical protein [Anaerolineales bacterium]
MSQEKFFAVVVKKEGVNRSWLPMVHLLWRKGVWLIGFSTRDLAYACLSTSFAWCPLHHKSADMTR